MSSMFDTPTGLWRSTDGQIESTDWKMVCVTKGPPEDEDPWLRWNLDGLYLVQTVEIVRRLDCCFNEMETLEVRVGE